MGYETEALIKEFQHDVGGGYKITFQAEARPGDPDLFFRHYQDGDRELESLKEHVGASNAFEIMQKRGRVPVRYDGDWHIEV